MVLRPMSRRNDEIRERLLGTFRPEAEEHLQGITESLSALRGGLSPAQALPAWEALFRTVHTLKGAARSVGMTNVETLCQELEAVLRRITQGDLQPDRPLLDRLQETVDGLTRLLNDTGAAVAVEALVAGLDRAEPELAVSEPDATEAPTVAQPAGGCGDPAEARVDPVTVPTAASETIRVATEKLDMLLLQFEDLLLPRLSAGERARDAHALLAAAARCRRASNGDLAAALRAIETQAQHLLRRLVEDERTLCRVVNTLQDDACRLRMSPASLILDLFPRMGRDLAREAGKYLEVVIQGADLELDRKILEAMKDPLIHLVRNAIDHGIEPPGARTRAGKPPQGRVTISLLSREDRRIEFRVGDDGNGISLEQVRAAAIRSHALAADEAETLENDEALALVFQSGFSTSPIVTRVSGQGLGMAIVKERVESLGGQVRLETQAGQGTTVHMVLPAGIATFRGLLVRAGQLFLLPIESVEQTLRVTLKEAQSLDGRPAVRWNDQPLPIVPLRELLVLERGGVVPDLDSPQPCVVVGSGLERLALLVDEILGDREVLVKKLGPPFVRVRNVAAAGILGTGELALILRPPDLLRSARTLSRLAASPRAEEDALPRTILVVDDSITTRTMEQNMLEAAGYRVQVAVDGMDAWTLLMSETFDLVVSDVDMPRMDGFELTARIRAEAKLVDLPVVLVTAMETREDKERGILSGANAYVIKSSFDESNLLEIIRRLV